MIEKKLAQAMRLMFTGTVVVSAVAFPAHAQESTNKDVQKVEVTGSRLKKIDLQSSSPTVTVTAAEIQANQDITLESFLNTLPQINPAGTTTSNNPGNGGQANIDMRGLGANRNLVLIDGTRPMVSSSNQTVDLNTIPMALIDSIEIISGGAAAVYGADAVAGVINIKLKKRFQGIDLRVGSSQSSKYKDAKEKSFQGVLGGNFADGKGNAVIGFEFAKRDPLIKGQRNFSSTATSTTSAFPEGRYSGGSNSPTQAAVDALFAGYGYKGAQIPRTDGFSFNTDGSLFYTGKFNSPLDVYNFKYPIDKGVNTNFYPDFYSYNFDPVNLLVLPMERRSVIAKTDYKLDNGVQVNFKISNTRYSSSTALAPTPISGVRWGAVGDSVAPTTIVSSFIEKGKSPSLGLVIPVTNPFIPKDLAALLASRTGDDPNIVGSGATEPFALTWRTVAAGLRQSEFSNEVTQYATGAKGDIMNTGWTWETHLSEGRTKIDQSQLGNINGTKLAELVAAADGGKSKCAGGLNPFGRQPLSAECIAYLQAPTSLSREFKQTIVQAFVSGDIMETSSGAISMVAGAEKRRFEYSFNPGAASGPIFGFNSQSPANAKNKFDDYFGELSVPVAKNQSWAKSANLSIAYRNTQSQASDIQNKKETPTTTSNAFAVNFDWQPTSEYRARASMQRAVRAPNFGELFDGSSSAPSYFDPCSVSSVGRTTGANAAKLSALCGSTKSPVAGNTTFVATPGAQANISLGGNLNLKPENSTSSTLGLVWTPSNNGMFKDFRGTFDYYNIKVKDAIMTPDINGFISSCYNYLGGNPNYDPKHPSCDALQRSGDNIVGATNPANSTGTFTNSNGGEIDTSGVDISLGWTGKVGPGKLDLQGFWTYLLAMKIKNSELLPSLDVTGTIPYFGAGLGQAFPKNKVTAVASYKINDFGADIRMRYIGEMTNRMASLFPGEKLTGVKGTYYWDLGANYQVTKGITIRAGINNLFDFQPRQYSPNVQSGTDPSTYDTIGRRIFVNANFSFK